MSCEHLEARRLLAFITAPELTFGDAGEASVDGSLLLSTTRAGQLIAAGPDKAVRLNADGSIDPTFRDPGLPEPQATKAFTIRRALRTDSQIIFGGSLSDENGSGDRSARLVLRAIRAGSGRPDTSFGTNGLAILSLDPLQDGTQFSGVGVSDLAVAGDGGFFAAVAQNLLVPGTSVRKSAVYKFTAAGAIDTGFGDGGLIAFPSEADAFIDAIAVDAQGRLLIVDTDESENGHFINRFLANGDVDTSFGTAGRKMLADTFGFGPIYDKVAFQPDGEIILAGQSFFDGGTSSGLRRLNSDGSDSTFGEAMNAATFLDDKILNIAIDADGRVTGATRMLIFRTNADGTLDTTFSDGAGVAILPRPLARANRTPILLDDSANLIVGAPTRTTRFVQRSAAELLNGVLRIEGTPGDDSISFSSAGILISAVLNGVTTSFSTTWFDEIKIFTGPGASNIDVSLNRPTTVVAGDGNDSITTTGGSTIETGQGGDTVATGAGDDEVLLGEVGLVNTGAGDDTITLTLRDNRGDRPTLNGGDGDDVIDAMDYIASVSGGSGNDLIRMGGGRFQGSGGVASPFSTLSGGNGDDTILGVGGNDSIDGGAGDDLLKGGFDHDVIAGGDGRDTIDGGFNTDTLVGGANADFITGGSSADLISGGGGKDSLFGAGGNDRIYGGDGDDKINGEAGDDLIEGNAGRDTIGGGSGDDFIRGGEGADWLYGQPGVDTLVGDGGNDRLSGGFDRDTMFGGAGDDLFIARDASGDLLGGNGDSVNGSSGNDAAQVDPTDRLESIEVIDVL